MYTLTKHKKLGLKGFKTFVKNLELFPEETVKTIISVGLLEDPVYIKWALKNKVGFHYFLKLDYESVLKVISKLGRSGLQLIVFAIKDHELEDEFLKKNMTEKVLFEYEELSKYTLVTEQESNIGKFRIMEVMLELEMNYEIPSFAWDLPSLEVMQGKSHRLGKDGSYLQKYLNGNIALEGQLIHMLREGSWRHYYPNGSLMAEGIYLQGEKNGNWDFYHPDGSRKSVGSYKEDLKNGKWIEYANGEGLELKYKEGKLI